VNPHSEYQSRLQARRAEANRLARRQILLGYPRLASAILFFVLAWYAPQWTIVPAVAFGVLVRFHDRLRRAHRHVSRAAAACERGLARLEHRWAGTGESGERFRDPSHPYADDLDVFGPGGLFELLSTARTRMGEHTLAAWLLRPAAPGVARERQAAVAELRDRLGLREDLAVLGEDARADVHPETLLRWAAEPPVFDSRAARLAAAGLALLAVAGVAVVAVWGRLAPLAAILALEAAFVCWFRSRVQHVVYAIECAAHDLDLLTGVLLRLERERFQSPLLARLRAALETAGLPPSRQFTRLHRLVEWLDSQDNWFLRIIGPPLLMTTQLAFAVEAWRKQAGPQVRRWVEAVGEMEALCALAGYAWEHPDDPFPEFLDGKGRFEGEALGHPLLADDRLVRNDVRLAADHPLLVVSGSNMSGKSTLLRTVGINAVLAMAGAPVRARRLRLSPLTVAGAIRVTDSLQGGASRFYAEITRLRQMVDLANGSFPVLFLLDELLHDTNPNDRRAGSDAVLRTLVGRGSIGLITTHDLALTQIAAALAGSNVHFEDHIENGRVLFDYRLRPGVVEKSNALELMRSIGLEV